MLPEDVPRTISLKFKTKLVFTSTNVESSVGVNEVIVGAVPGVSVLHAGSLPKVPSLFPSSSDKVVPVPLSLSIV